MTEVFSPANPEWYAKRLVVEHYNRASTLMGLAASDPAHYLPDFKAAVAALYGFLRCKMYQYANVIKVKKENLHKYDELVLNRKAFKAAKYSEIVEWFFDIQWAVERLGYTHFEKNEDLVERMFLARGLDPDVVED